MDISRLLENVKTSIVNYDTQGAVNAADAALKEGVDPLAILGSASEGIRIVGERFQRLEVFLPHLMMSAEAMVAVEKLVEQNLPRSKKVEGRVKVVLGTIEGDLHDIGKNIVFAMLTGAGFEVYDLGKDVPIGKFIDNAKEVGADIIGVSALMTTTMDGQRKLIEELSRLGLRAKFKVMVGGGSTSEQWAKQISADGYAKDCNEAVKIALALTGKKN
jgi:corrinoid protein of di/trimethylamine methyltransferase